jgi:hypothetical protein
MAWLRGWILVAVLVARTTTLRVQRSSGPQPPQTAAVTPLTSPIVASDAKFAVEQATGAVSPTRRAKLPPREKRVGPPQRPRRARAPPQPPPGALLGVDGRTNTSAMYEEASC